MGFPMKKKPGSLGDLLGMNFSPVISGDYVINHEIRIKKKHQVSFPQGPR